MKRPLLNMDQRQSIRLETLEGATLEMNLAVQHLRRDVYKTKGWLAMKKAERDIVTYMNLSIFGREYVSPIKRFAFRFLDLGISDAFSYLYVWLWLMKLSGIAAIIIHILNR